MKWGKIIMNVLRLRCQSCNGFLQYDINNPIVFCPYCGEKLLIVESDNVKIQENESKTRIILQNSMQDHEKDMKTLEYRIKREENKNQSKDTIFALTVGIGLFVAVALFSFLFAYFSA